MPLAVVAAAYGRRGCEVNATKRSRQQWVSRAENGDQESGNTSRDAATANFTQNQSVTDPALSVARVRLPPLTSKSGTAGAVHAATETVGQRPTARRCAAPDSPDPAAGPRPAGAAAHPEPATTGCPRDRRRTGLFRANGLPRSASADGCRRAGLLRRAGSLLSGAQKLATGGHESCRAPMNDGQKSRNPTL